MMKINRAMKRVQRELQRLRRGGKKIPSSSSIRLMLGIMLLYFYTSMIMFFLFNHHHNNITEEYLSTNLPRYQFLPIVRSIEEKCWNHPVWLNDINWKKAVIDPILCGVSIKEDETPTSLVEQQLLLFQETMYNYSHYMEPPCGQYCIYPFQSVHSYSYGQHILGYALRSSPDNPNIKCWKPFTTQYEYNPCGNEHYDWWINTMEKFVSTSLVPAYQCRSRHHSTTAGIIANSKADFHIENSRENYCQDLEVVHEYILQQSVKRYECRIFEEEMNMKLSDKVILWLTSSNRTRRAKVKSRISKFKNKEKVKQQERQSSPFCNKQILKLSNPSDIARLYDINQLGLHSLADAMTIFNYSSTIDTNDLTNVSQSFCYDESNMCIYHHHSIPSNFDDDHHAIKGWEYSRLHQCFIPLVDMTSHPTCGRRSNQYKTWSQIMVRKQLIELDRSISLPKKSAKAACAICDKLPLSTGRYTWDYKKSSYKAIHIPPTDDIGNTDNTVCGPRIIFAGAAKCGTNQLPRLLAQHPRIALNLCPDSSLEKCNIKFFQGDYNNYTHSIASIWDSGGLSHGYMSDPINYISQYAGKLPVPRMGDEQQMTIELSSSYINTETFPNIAQRTHTLLPNAKIIFSVCDPVKRMHLEYDQNWNHQSYAEAFYKNNGVRIPTNFHEYVQDMDLQSTNCKNKPIFCYKLRRDKLDTGRYVNHIRQWQNYYGKENVLVLNMDDSNEHKMKQIFNLMGDCLPASEYPWGMVFPANREDKKVVHKQRYDDAYGWLYEYFNESNTELSNEVEETYPKEWFMKKEIKENINK